MQSWLVGILGAGLALGLACAAAAETPPGTPPKPAPDLPTVDVPPRPLYVVPDSDQPSRPIILKGRDGQETTPRSSGLASRTSPPAAARVIGGSARVLDAVTLVIGWRPVTLFGVRAPATHDRCTLAGEAPHRCSELARDLLALRLYRNASVSCRVPPGQRGGKQDAICLDTAGIDLGGWLVAEGLALADSAGSFDYVGAQSVARSVRRGLWRYR